MNEIVGTRLGAFPVVSLHEYGHPAREGRPTFIQQPAIFAKEQGTKGPSAKLQKFSTIVEVGFVTGKTIKVSRPSPDHQSSALTQYQGPVQRRLAAYDFRAVDTLGGIAGVNHQL